MRTKSNLWLCLAVFVISAGVLLGMDTSSENFKAGYSQGVEWRHGTRPFPSEIGEIKNAAQAEGHLGFVCGWSSIVSKDIEKHVKAWVLNIKQDGPTIEGFLNGFRFTARRNEAIFSIPDINAPTEVKNRCVFGYLLGMQVAQAVKCQGDLNQVFGDYKVISERKNMFQIGWARALTDKGNLYKATHFEFLPNDLTEYSRVDQRAFQFGFVTGFWYLRSTQTDRLKTVLKVMNKTEWYQEGWLAGYFMGARWHDKRAKSYLACIRNQGKTSRDFGEGFKDGYRFFNPRVKENDVKHFLSSLFETGGNPVATSETPVEQITTSSLLFHYCLSANVFNYPPPHNPEVLEKLEKLGGIYLDLVRRQLDKGITRAIDELICQGTEMVNPSSSFMWGNKIKTLSDRELLRPLARKTVELMKANLVHTTGDPMGLKVKVSVLQKF